MIEVVEFLVADRAVFAVLSAIVFYALYIGKWSWNGRNGSYHGGYWKDAPTQQKTDD